MFISVTLLPTRMRKAIKIQQESQRTLEDLINSSPGILVIIKATIMNVYYFSEVFYL